MRKGNKLTDKQNAFVREYLVDLCGAKAAVRAGYSTRVAKSIACELLQNPLIEQQLAVAMAARAERTEITQDKVLRDLWSIAQADARELIELRRTCCRYCWGVGFRYQSTAGEMERARAVWAALPPKQRVAAGGVFDEKGGVGFHAKRDPNADCPECFGDGVETVHAHDSRKLSPSAARLYAGVKQTKEGLEIRTHDQKSALVDVGRHLGLFPNRNEHTGKNGEPLPATVVAPVFNITLSDE